MNAHASLHHPVLLWGITLALTGNAHAAGWLHVDDAMPESANGGQHFGQAVAADRYADGSIRALYVGVPNADVVAKGTTYSHAGRVDVLIPQGGWHVAATITHNMNNNWQANAHFGAALAVRNGIIVIGAPNWDDVAHGHSEVGASVVYRDIDSGNPSQPVPNITALHELFYSTSPGTGAHRGDSVDVDGDISSGAFIAVGAPDYGGGTGCADVFRLDLTTWALQGNACGTTAEKFGASVAIHANSGSYFHLVTGSPGKIQNGNALAGEANVYVLGSGDLMHVGTLKAQNPAFLDTFGTAVAIDADRVYIAGTGRNKPSVGRTGSVSLFDSGGYGFDRELFPGDGAAGDLCGASLSLDFAFPGSFAVGCPGSDGLVSGEGFARVFTLGTFLGSPFWFQDRLDMSDIPHGADDMGRSVLLAGDHVYAGAPLTEYFHANDVGVVRVFATDNIFRDGFQ